MYTTGTQKKYWTFSSQNEIDKLRQTANENFIAKYRQQIESGRIALDEFFSPNDELVFCRIVAETGMRYCLLEKFKIIATLLDFMMILFLLYGLL